MSYLKYYFDDYVTTYLEPYYLESVKNIEPKNEVEERAITFFVKAISCFKSINTLFSQGDVVSARILMRSLFEVIIMLKKISKDKDEFIRYSKAYEKFKQIDACKIELANLNNSSFSFYTESELNTKIEILKNEISELEFLPTWNKENGRPKVDGYFEVKGLATDVDMVDLYDSIYKNLCLDTHTSSSHFYKYFAQLDNGKKQIILHPYLHELDLMIYTVCGIFDGFFEFVEDVLGVSSTCLANSQFQKLKIMTMDLLPILKQQGALKKAGFIAPLF